MREEIRPLPIRPSAESAFTLEVSKTGLMAGKKHFCFLNNTLESWITIQNVRRIPKFA